jgi:predicted site-specific integrase-resolvase
MSMYTVSKFAKKVGVTVHTLQRWDREVRLKAKRTHRGRWYYTDADMAQVLSGAVMTTVKSVIVYCRVSSSAQKSVIWVA